MKTLLQAWKSNSVLVIVIFLLLLAGGVNLYITLSVLANDPSFAFIEYKPSKSILCIDEPLVIEVESVNKPGWSINTYAQTIYYADTMEFAKLFPQPEVAISGLANSETRFIKYTYSVDTGGLEEGDYIYALSTAQEEKRATGFAIPFKVVNCNP